MDKKPIEDAVNWAVDGHAESFAEYWDVQADDVAPLDPEGANEMRGIARAVRKCADYFIQRAKG